jgi:hypothetical protein
MLQCLLEVTALNINTVLRSMSEGLRDTSGDQKLLPHSVNFMRLGSDQYKISCSYFKSAVSKGYVRRLFGK